MEDFDLEEEIRNCEWILKKVRTRDDYAQNLYAAFCNMQWCKRKMWNVLKEEYWSCSWRGAGGVVADLRNKGEDYMDWYCSGMGGVAAFTEDDPDSLESNFYKKKYVPEGTVTEEIEQDLGELGWFPVPWPKDI